MKRIDMFCSSPASTEVIHQSSIMLRRSRSTKNYYEHERRKNQLHRAPCSSQLLLPINPKPYFEKHRKSSADKQVNNDTRRKSSVHVKDLSSNYPSVADSSRRYLLDDKPFIDWVSESNKMVSKLDPKTMSMDMKRKDSHALVRFSSSALSDKDQVVVLRVSLHCRACEGKVRKHISKMEGVTSFSIEMETKKVTIIGNVTPSSVLESVSKVKSAQLWSSPTLSSSYFP